MLTGGERGKEHLRESASEEEVEGDTYAEQFSASCTFCAIYVSDSVHILLQ